VNPQTGKHVLRRSTPLCRPMRLPSDLMSGQTTMCDALLTETITSLQWTTQHGILCKPGSLKQSNITTHILICLQASSHLLTMQKPVSECYVIERHLSGQLSSGLNITHCLMLTEGWML